MVHRKISFCVLVLLAVSLSFGQTRFRSGIFLHHSTGGNIWGPNGGQVSIPTELARFDSSHSFHGADSMRMEEQWWPAGADNEWSTWHEIFENRLPSEDIRPHLAAHPIIMIKSCFPSSSMSGRGSSSDTSNPTVKSVANYKWHWRSIISVMKSHPENFFVLWTNAPLEGASTNASEATLSNSFCRWAKDTLAMGLDPVFGAFPKNVYVFDFYHLLADSTGILPDMYATAAGDSHPNEAATTLVAPHLVSEVFGAALAYETVSSVGSVEPAIPGRFELEQNFPNPFNPSTVVSSQYSVVSDVSIKIFDLLGREVATLVNERRAPGRYHDTFNATGLASGVYIYRLTAGSLTQSRKMVLMR
jgi:hypothetical protein